MSNMPGVTLREVSGLFKDLNDKLIGLEGEAWREKLAKLLRGEPVNTKEMIYPPLEWARNCCPLHPQFIQDYVDGSITENGWRLPTHGELTREIRVRPDGFMERQFYWTSTPHYAGRGFSVVNAYGSRGHLDYNSSDNYSAYPHLRLCRNLKLPE